MTSHTFGAGAILRGTVRSFLNRVEMEYSEFRWKETKRFLSSDFHISGPSAVITVVLNSLRKFQEENEL